MKIVNIGVLVVVGVVGLGAFSLYSTSSSKSSGSSSSTTANTVGCAGQSVGSSSTASPVWASVPVAPTNPPAVAALRGPHSAFATPIGAAAVVNPPVITPPVVTPPSVAASDVATTATSEAPASGAAPAASSSYCDMTANGAAAGVRTGGATAGWDPGNIISDQVFFNTASMTTAQIRSFVTAQDTACAASNPWCLKNLKVTFPAQAADQYCQAVPAGNQIDAATAISEFSTACGINPQVMLTTLQKESQGLSRPNPTAANYDAAWGWNCPDTGAGGSANCDPAGKGFFLQGYQMAKQWAKYKQRIPTGYYPYQPGKTVTILWNVEQSGCGGAPVTIANIATAALYVYTPYQPNAASLAAYPGEGDKCSAYGNRNYFRMFQKYFGDTGGGVVAAATTVQQAGYNPGTGTGTGGLGPISVSHTGNLVTIPAVAHVPAAMQGQTITGPTPAVATAIAAGMSWLGTPYSWGGGGAGGPSTGICGPDGAENDCHVTGFDCSGLTRYVASKWGAAIPQISGDQRASAHAVPWSNAQPGDIVGYSGHVTIYIGTFNGVRMQLEAPYSGAFIQISNVGNAETPDSNTYRYWQ